MFQFKYYYTSDGVIRSYVNCKIHRMLEKRGEKPPDVYTVYSAPFPTFISPCI